MALKMLCQLLVALCVVGYANAVSSGKAVRLRLFFNERVIILLVYSGALKNPLLPCGPSVGEVVARDHAVSKALSCFRSLRSLPIFHPAADQALISVSQDPVRCIAFRGAEHARDQIVSPAKI